MTDTIAPIKTAVYDPIFKQKVQVFCNCTERDYLIWQKRLNVSNIDGLDSNLRAFSTHVSSEGMPNIYVIWLNRFSWTLDDQESLVHEVVHTVVSIWEANDISFVPETQEFFAQSTGRLYSLIASKIMIREKTVNK